jgi:hypothetical protein
MSRTNHPRRRPQRPKLRQLDLYAGLADLLPRQAAPAYPAPLTHRPFRADREA